MKSQIASNLNSGSSGEKNLKKSEGTGRPRSNAKSKEYKKVIFKLRKGVKRQLSIFKKSIGKISANPDTALRWWNHWNIKQLLEVKRSLSLLFLLLWAIKELSRFIMCSQFHNFQFGKRRTLSLSNDKWHFSLCNIPLARVPMTSSSDLLQQLCFLRKLRGAFSDYIRKMYRCIISQFLLLLYKLLKSCTVKLLICTSKLSPLKRYNAILKKEFT